MNKEESHDYCFVVDLGTPRDEVSEPLGVETLAAYVEKEFGSEVRVDIRSLELDNVPNIEGYLLSGYSVVGLSTKIRAYKRFHESMEVIRRISPKSKIFVGDILGTYAFDEVLEKYPEVICVRGEGEESFPSAIRALYSKNPDTALTQVPNLAFVSSGKIILTKRKSFDINGATRPKRVLARTVFEQHGIGRVEASRGCVYSMCGFCGVVEKYAGPGWKPFDLNFVMAELGTLSALGFNSPYFTDEDFVGDDIARIYELCNRISEGKRIGSINPGMDLYINLRANSILGSGFGGENESARLLRKLKQIGLREVFVGIESGCREQLVKRYAKGVSKQRNIQAIKMLRKVGLEIDLGFIFFDQDSTIAELRENITFIYEADIALHDSHLIKRIRIEPRTPIGVKFLVANPGTKVDLNSVEFPYTFRHPEVEVIYAVFTQWQSRDLDVIYNLQSFCRGEIPRGYSRAEVKSIIAQYRQLDVQFLDAVLSIFESGEGQRDNRIVEVVKQFDKRRNGLDVLLLYRVQWLDSNFRRFKV